MAQSIRNIISLVNQSLEGIFKGSKLYGVANLVERQGKVMPVVDELPVSFDDSYALQIYHRISGVNISYLPGYGNQQTTIDTFACAAIVFNNEKITKVKTDEIAMIIQSVLAVLNITSVRIQPVSIILNSQAVFNTEYNGVKYSLNEYQSLMQINYLVEVTFKGNCFTVCPEDFSKCKN